MQVVDVLLADAQPVVLHHEQRSTHSPLQSSFARKTKGGGGTDGLDWTRKNVLTNNRLAVVVGQFVVQTNRSIDALVLCIIVDHTSVGQEALCRSHRSAIKKIYRRSLPVLLPHSAPIKASPVGTPYPLAEETWHQHRLS